MAEFLPENQGEIQKEENIPNFSFNSFIGRVYGLKKIGDVMAWYPREGDQQSRSANENPTTAEEVIKEMNRINGQRYIDNIDRRQKGIF